MGAKHEFYSANTTKIEFLYIIFTACLSKGDLLLNV